MITKEEIRKRLQERVKQKRKALANPKYQKPRYDEVFAEGVRWLEENG